MAQTKFISLNVKGFNSPEKRSLILNDVWHRKPQVLLLQETHYTEASHPRSHGRRFPLSYHSYSDCSKSRGVSILFSRSAVWEFKEVITDGRGRFILLKGSFNRKRRSSIFVTVTLFVVSALILTVGLAATTRTENVTVGGYYPGVILGFGSILGIIGSNLIENKRQMLVASIVFISFGVIAAFCCAIVDGVFAARHLDLRPIYAGKCRYLASGDDRSADTEVMCQMPIRGSCSLKVKSNTCYCCDLYNCGRAGITGLYYEYSEVKSCQDVIHLYHLLWSVTILNIVGLFLGIITAAILGGFKDMNPAIPAISCVVETPRPTVQYNTRPPVPSYNTYYHSTPHLPPYTAYDLQHSNIFPASTPSGLSDDPSSTSQSGPSFMWPSGAPPRYSPPYFPPDEKPPPYTP